MCWFILLAFPPVSQFCMLMNRGVNWHSFRLDTGVVHFVTSDIAKMLFSGVKGSLHFFICFLVELHFSDLNSLVFQL